MGKLILLRHGKSVWNKKNIFTGWVDVSLSHEGVKEACSAGKVLSKIKFDAIFTSKLSRAQFTLQLLMLENQDSRALYFEHENEKWYQNGVGSLNGIKVVISDALNERYYGDLQGKDKEEFKKQVGEELFKEYRRSFSLSPPNGESLKDTVDRTLPFFNQQILPKIIKGETVLVVAHGNSIRGIIKQILDISDKKIVEYEIQTGKPLLFNFINNSFKEAKI
jgi:2,3-bisphosphoglycerate-dependent phosphoglycerate mutase